jgi:membrane protease YdiL (CAAX protease family)
VFAVVASACLVASRYCLSTILAPLRSILESVPALASDRALVQGWLEVVTKLGRGIVLFFVPLLTVLALRIRLPEVGFSVGRWKNWLRDTGILYLVMLPLLYWAAQRPSFRQVYPYFLLARQGLGYFIIGLAVRLVYMFCWEFFFRGFLLLGFERKVGPAAAIAVSTIPFVLMHFGKPVPEIYGSIVAGVVLGIVALRARSFLPAAILHFAVAATLDVAAVIVN